MMVLLSTAIFLLAIFALFLNFKSRERLAADRILRFFLFLGLVYVFSTFLFFNMLTEGSHHLDSEGSMGLMYTPLLFLCLLAAVVFVYVYQVVRFRKERSAVVEVQYIESEVLAYIYRPDVPPREKEADGMVEEGEVNIAEFLDSLVFLDPDLDIGAVATQFHVSDEELARVIKEKTGLGFGQYINRCRAEYAGARMKAKDYEGTIEELGLSAGFRSKASFYRNFKKFMGCTPSEYME